MFTPQRKQWPTLTINPRGDDAPPPSRDTHKLNPSSGKGKGKVVAFADEVTMLTPPPVGLLSDNGGDRVMAELENMDDWRGFKDAGLLDESEWERRDREAMRAKLAQFEKELYDYQYNMGLLLIEKKEWNSKFNELREALSETEEILKREQTAHLISINEVEKREENLKRTLSHEKQRISELERALRETRSEYDQIKVTSDSKISNANALIAGVEEQSMDIQGKVHFAEAKLAEANRKSLELERKFQEIESRESVLRRERISLKTEREAYEASVLKHKEDLRNWEKKLHEGEERLCENRRMINQREEKANEFDRLFEEKKKEFEEKKKEIDLVYLTSKEKEEKINKKLLELTLQEEKFVSLKSDLEAKEKDLQSWSEKLNSRERVEIQKIIDEHRMNLESEKEKFELEMEGKKVTLDLELKQKVKDLEQKEVEINHKEEKLRKREQALENKSERIKEKEKEIESKSKLIKENEKSLKSEEKRLESVKKEVAHEKESFENDKLTLEKLKSEISENEQKIIEEREKLKVTEDERSEMVRLKTEIKREIESYKVNKELVMKEQEVLKQDRCHFEKEWEELDVKRDEITKEMKLLEEKKEIFEKFRKSVEEKMRREKDETESFVKREIERVEIEKSEFFANLEHEKSILNEKIENEEKKLVHEFEMRKREFEEKIRIKENEMEKDFKERERVLEEKIVDFNKFKGLIEIEKEEIRVKKAKFEKEKEEIELRKKELEGHQREMEKDINELGGLSEKIKSQRECLVNEKNRFFSFVEKFKNCENCGEVVRGYLLSDHSTLPVLGDELLEKVHSYATKSESSLPGDSEGGVSILVKCEGKKVKNVLKVPESSVNEEPESSRKSVLRRSSRKSVRGSKQNVVEKVGPGEEEGKSRRKRNREKTGGASEVEGDVSEDCSVSVTTGGARKRRNVGNATPQRQYNLRRKKTVGTADVSVEEGNRRKEEVGPTKAETETESESRNPRQGLVKVTSQKRYEGQEVTSSRVVKFKEPEVEVEVEGEVKSYENVHLSEELIHTPEENHVDDDDDDEHGSTLHDDDDVDDDDGDKDVSVGRKLWTFFTS